MLLGGVLASIKRGDVEKVGGKGKGRGHLDASLQDECGKAL